MPGLKTRPVNRHYTNSRFLKAGGSSRQCLSNRPVEYTTPRRTIFFTLGPCHQYCQPAVTDIHVDPNSPRPPGECHNHGSIVLTGISYRNILHQVSLLLSSCQWRPSPLSLFPPGSPTVPGWLARSCWPRSCRCNNHKQQQNRHAPSSACMATATMPV